MTAFFPSAISQDVKDRILASFEPTITAVTEKRNEVKAVSAGWGLEQDFPVRGRGGRETGDNGTVFFVLVGWEEVNRISMEKLRHDVSLLVENKDCVAWDEFLVECQVLDRASK
jgi:hypothetical protein